MAATSAEVQLVCLSTTLVIIEYGKDHHSKCNFKTQRPTLLNLGAIPTGTPLLHPSGLSIDASHHVRFLSYVETQHEVSLVFEERLLAKFPEEHWNSSSCAGRRYRWHQLGRSFPEPTSSAHTAHDGAGKHGISVFRSRRTSLTMVSLWPVELINVSESGRLGKGLQMSTEFCSIEMEDGQELRVTEDVDSQEENADAKELPTYTGCEVASRATQQNIREEAHVLARELLFKSEDGSATRFLSYSETGDDISVVTSDENFLEKARALMKQGDQGVLTCTDWKYEVGVRETGIVAGQTRVLVNAGTTVFYLSTYATDFMLIKEDEWEDALPILRDHFSLTEGVFAPLTA
ncbi:GATS-like ACT domain [Phytophthora cactorum]|nr:GATS-like ACT domain [Phytophthora cactorum]